MICTNCYSLYCFVPTFFCCVRWK